MDQVSLGSNGLRVSRVGLGMWQAGGTPWGDDFGDEDCVAAMVRAHELGVNFIDTAEVYGNGHSEEVVGRALQEIGRDEVVVASKLSPGHARYEDVLKACERSRQRLGIDVIDLYQLHAPPYLDQIPLKETMRALEKLHKEGAIRAVGVSNFAVRDLEEARAALSSADIVSDQVQYSMLHREVEKEVLPYCQREGIAVLAWSPLAKGALTGKYDPARRPEDPLRQGHPLFRERNLASLAKLMEILQEVAQAHGRTIPQVALNWLLEKERVIPIPGAKRPAQVEDNVGAAGWTITADGQSRLETALQDVRIDAFAE